MDNNKHEIGRYKSLLIALFSSLIRFYDYSLFGLSAGIVSKALMPSADSSEQLKFFFFIFSLAVFMRPLGSVIFGTIGDKVGRIVSVKIATIFASFSTLTIGLIPEYSEIGLWSAGFLFVARVLFLLSLAGEVDAIKVYVAEMVSKSRRNLASGVVTLFSQTGVLIAAVVYNFTVSYRGEAELWRYGFIGGALAGLGLFLLRSKLVESEIFLESNSKVKSKHSLVHGALKESASNFIINKSDSNSTLKLDEENFHEKSLISIISHYRLKFILSIMLNGAIGGIYNFLIIFLATFSSNVLKVITISEAAFLNVELVFIYIVASLISGAIADRVNYYSQVYISFAITLFFTLLTIISFSYGSYYVGCHKILVACVPFFIIPTYVKIQSLFSSYVRMRMVSLSHSLGSMIFSSTVPILGMLLWQMTNLYSIVLSLFAVQVISIAIVAAVMYKKGL